MKLKTAYLCQQCGQSYSKWMGRCQECGTWNSVVEERVPTSKSKASSNGRPQSQPKPIAEIGMDSVERISIDLKELDGVLGGGLVPGSVVLLGGEPGIGKSTLLIQAASHYSSKGMKVLYVSAEESASQIAMRARRLGLESDNLLVVSETNLELILNHYEKLSPQVAIIDSIQTIQTEEMDSQPGSVGQIRECANQLINYAKGFGIPTFLVGHVTKEGAIAGPKILEHMVDVVLYFQDTASQNFRLLRTIKNRFGSTNEIGVFEMTSSGMREVRNPSELFLMERPECIPGSAIVPAIEGTRPILVEIQALISQSALTIPRRTSIGLDQNRATLLVAILEKRGGFRLYDQDVYINIAGGLRLSETALDLAVVAAMISSFTGRPLDSKSVFFGEVGLGGEVRAVPRVDLRLKEAARIGFTRAYLPKRAALEIKKYEGLELIGLDQIVQLSDFL